MFAIPLVIKHVFRKSCRKLGALPLLFILIPLTSYATTQNELTGIQIINVANSPTPQVDLSFNNAVDYKVFTLPNPNRLVVDLKDCRAGIKTDQIDLSNSPIAKVRIGIQTGVNLRVVFDLKQPVLPKSMIINNTGSELIAIALNEGEEGNSASAGALNNTAGNIATAASSGNNSTAQLSAGNTGNSAAEQTTAGNSTGEQLASTAASAFATGGEVTVKTSTAVRSADIEVEPTSSTEQNSQTTAVNNSSSAPTSTSRVEQMSIDADLNNQTGSSTSKNSVAAAEQIGNTRSSLGNGSVNNASNNSNLNQASNQNSTININSNANTSSRENTNSSINQTQNSNITTPTSLNASADAATASTHPSDNATNSNSNVNAVNTSNNMDANSSNNINGDGNSINDNNNVNADESNHLYTSRLRNIFSSASSNNRTVIVVIDAGHGGKDPGATGPMGLHEKTVTLAIAEDLKHLIDKQKGMHAVLTRHGDYYVGLRDRLAIARKDKGDMFIAIHADAAPAISGYEATGATVYALSLHGASSEAARWIAEKENYSELGGIDLDTIQDSDNMVRSVLIDLSQTATISDSLILGRSVLHQLSDLSPLHHDVVEQAPFMVLKSPDIPSILVETGYITNPQEETHLRDPLYQEELAHAMLNGVKNYFVHYAPPGSWLASNRESLEGRETRTS